MVTALDEPPLGLSTATSSWHNGYELEAGMDVRRPFCRVSSVKSIAEQPRILDWDEGYAALEPQITPKLKVGESLKTIRPHLPATPLPMDKGPNWVGGGPRTLSQGRGLGPPWLPCGPPATRRRLRRSVELRQTDQTQPSPKQPNVVHALIGASIVSSFFPASGCCGCFGVLYCRKCLCRQKKPEKKNPDKKQLAKNK